MDTWTAMPADAVIEKTAIALRANNFDVIVVSSAEEAKEKALSLIPEKSEVMTMTSVTNDTIGLNAAINESGKYNSVRNKLNKLDRRTNGHEMQLLGAAPEYATGSAHALTQDGHLLIASNTGSQLGAEAYGSPHVIYVIGAQKIVANTDEGLHRIYEHSLPLETKRARKAYGLPDDWNSAVRKVLIYNSEVMPGRTHIIIVKEVLGF